MAEGHQGEQGADGQQHGQVEKAEGEVHQGGQGLAEQKFAQAIELGEVEGDLAHGTAIEEALGQAHQLIEDGGLGVLIDPVGQHR